jgi:hypothetical protein
VDIFPEQAEMETFANPVEPKNENNATEMPVQGKKQKMESLASFMEVGHDKTRQIP